MNSRLYAVSKALLSLAGLTLAMISSGSSWGAVVQPCTMETCGWSISVDGTEVMSGMYTVDPLTGDISLDQPVSMQGDGFTVSLNSMGGNVDPELVFGLGATNTSDAAKSFAFAFSLPLGGLPVPINTSATLGTTLSASSGASATVSPILSANKIVDSQDIRFSPSENQDKGVDIGDAFTVAAGVTATRDETATGQILTGGPYDLMSVTVAFALTDNETGIGSPGTGVGFSGRVTQTPVPIPPAVWLFGSGLLGIVGIARRRKKV